MVCKSEQIVGYFLCLPNFTEIKSYWPTDTMQRNCVQP